MILGFVLFQIKITKQNQVCCRKMIEFHKKYMYVFPKLPYTFLNLCNGQENVLILVLPTHLCVRHAGVIGSDVLG